MNTIADVSNWKLNIRREEQGITILRAVTCDRRAVLPEALFGLPVITLAPHVFSSAAKGGGEEVLVVHGKLPEEPEWNNSKLKELSLPRRLRSVGNCAFLTCWELQTLHLWDNIESWGSSVLNSCRSLQVAHIRRETAESGPSAPYLIQELNRELDLTVEAPEGTTRLIFPEYLEFEEESFISQAVEFSYSISGAGYPYHHCITRKQLDLKKYDDLWSPFLKQDHDPGTALRLAWWRLRYPTELSERAASDYAAYLRSHPEDALPWLLRREDTDGLRFLLKLTSPDRETLSRGCALAREAGFAAGLAILLEAQHASASPASARSFDL